MTGIKVALLLSEVSGSVAEFLKSDKHFDDWLWEQWSWLTRSVRVGGDVAGAEKSADHGGGSR